MLATAAVIAGNPKSIASRKVLANPVMVHVGKISYPLYLWHWPLLVFARMINERDLPLIGRLAILALSFGLAEVTYRLVETRIRFGRRKARSAIRLVPALGSIGAVGILFAAGVVPVRLDLSKKRSLAEIGADWEAPRGGSAGHGFLMYRIGRDTTRRLVLAGDSHAQQYWPRFVQLADENSPDGPQKALVAYAGCPFLPNVNRVGKSWEDIPWNCPAFYDATMAYASQSSVKAIVLANFWEEYFTQKPIVPVGSSKPLASENDARTDAVFARFERDIARLTEKGKRVYIVLSNPTLASRDPVSSVPRRLVGFSSRATSEIISKSDFVVRVSPVMTRLRKAASQAGATVIDPVEFLCNDKFCPTVTENGVPIYRDYDHLRAGYVRANVSFPDHLLQ